MPSDPEIELPEGYDISVLGHIAWLTGYRDKEVVVSFRQAAELAMIGFQIQDLNKSGKLEPPLTYFQGQSIDHLLGEVCLLNFDGAMNSPKLTEADTAYIRATQETVRNNIG